MYPEITVGMIIKANYDNTNSITVFLYLIFYWLLPIDGPELMMLFSEDKSHLLTKSKGAGAFEAGSQTKEEFSAVDTSRHPKLFKIGPNHGCQ